MAMRRLLFTTAILLAACNASLAQVSTMGTTAMGLSSTPGTIVTSPLNGPSPFSATTQPGSLDTTLAPVPLASNPTTPGTVVICSTPTGQIAPGTAAVPVTSMSAPGGIIGTTISAVSATSSTSTNNTTAPMLTLSAQPATSFLATIPGTTVPAPPPPAIPAPPPPAMTAAPVPPPSTSAMSSAALMPATPMGTIPTPIVGSMTG